MTTGSKNTIIGRFNGNQAGLDIRTANNWIVLSDGDGNPRFFTNGTNGDTIIPGNTGNTTVVGGNGILLAHTDYTATYRKESNTSAYIHAFASDSGGTRAVKYAVYVNGSVGAVSDQRFKKNIEPARNYLDDLMNVEVVKYNWVSDDENAPKELGYIAQQVETVFPGMVDEQAYKDGNGEEITQKMLKKEVFVPMLIKAVQELNAKVIELEAKLESK
jgi:hypothetical protein